MRTFDDSKYKTISINTAKRLHDDLGIQPEQEAAWVSLFAQIALCNELLTQRNSTLSGPGLAPILDCEFELLSTRLEVIAALRPAVARLYAILSPRQQIRADRLLRAHCDVFTLTRGSADVTPIGLLERSNSFRARHAIATTAA